MAVIKLLFYSGLLIVMSMFMFALVNSLVNQAAVSWLLLIAFYLGVLWIARRAEKAKALRQQQLQDAVAETGRRQAEAAATAEAAAATAAAAAVAASAVPVGHAVAEPNPLPDAASGSVTSAHPDEAALLDAIAEAAHDVNSPRPWLIHPELGQVANVVMGAALVAEGQAAGALPYFDAVLAEPPCVAAEAFFDRYPIPVPFQAAGIDTDIPLSRSVAAIYAAMLYQTRDDSEHALEAIEQADDSDLVTALKASYLFNLDRYDDVLRATRWTPRPAETALEAFALALRGCALRDKGQPTDALTVLNQATAAAAGTPEVANRITFEIGRTLAAQGDVAEARRRYIQVHKADPQFPELEEALARLPPQ